MTIFRSSLALAVLLLAACDRPAAEKQEAEVAPAAVSAPETPITVASENMVVEAPEPSTSNPLAGTDEPTSSFQQCMETGEAGRGVTSGMRQCLAAELKRQDERLNAAYQAALGRIEPAEQAELRTLQRAWLNSRNEGCERKAEPNKGGSLYPVVVAQCLVDATIKRAGWLETYSPGKR